MNENSAVIKLETLGQSGYWVDRYGAEYALESMTEGYLRNVLGHLQKMAPNLYALELQRQSNMMLLAELSGWDNGRVLAIEPLNPVAAAAWLQDTPLVKAITALLDGTETRDEGTSWR